MFNHPFIFNIYNNEWKSIEDMNSIPLEDRNKSYYFLLSIKESSFYNRDSLFIGDVFIDLNEKNTLYVLETGIKNNVLTNIFFSKLYLDKNVKNNTDIFSKKLIEYKKVIEKNNLLYIGNVFLENKIINNFEKQLKENEKLIEEDTIYFFLNQISNINLNNYYDFFVLIKNKQENLVQKKLKDIYLFDDLIQLNEDYCQIMLGYHSKKLCASSNYLPSSDRNLYLSHDFIILPSGSIFITDKNVELVYNEMKMNHPHMLYSLEELKDTYLLRPLMNKYGDIVFYNKDEKYVEPIIHPESSFYKNYLYNLEDDDFIKIYLQLI